MSIKRGIFIVILLGLTVFISGKPADAVYDLEAIDWCYWFHEETGYIDFYGIVKNTGDEDVLLPVEGVYTLWLSRSKPTGPYLEARMDFDLNKEKGIIQPGSLKTLGPLSVPFDPKMTYSRLIFRIDSPKDQRTDNNKFDINLNLMGNDLKEDWTKIYAYTGEPPCIEKVRLGSRIIH